MRSLRYYEKQGLIAGRRLENDYRDFDETQLERVRAVQFYLGLGLSTDRIEGILNCQGRDAPPAKDPESSGQCEALLLLYQEHLVALDDQIKALEETRSRLKDRIALFQQHRDAVRPRTTR